jgi:NADH-quinone oxidoreductase subunit M
MTPVGLWLVCLAGLPLTVVLASLCTSNVERLRRIAVVCATGLLVVAAIALFVPGLRAFEVPLPAAPGLLTSGSALRIDALSSILIPLAAALWLLTVAVTPRTRLDRAGLRRTALATLVTMTFFMTTSPGLLLVLWILSNAVFLSALSGPESRRARRVAAVYLGASMLLFAVGVALVTRPAARGSGAERLGLALIIVAALIRKGIFPFHAWVPEVFARGRLGPAVLFSAPQLGSYVTAVLIVPLASTGALRTIAVLALVTAVYGAALALFQRDARRSCGYLFVSQSALVMAGLDCTSKVALAGSLVLWVSSALAFAGIARCVLVLESRRGRLDLTRHHGGYQQMPLLAVSFLALGLACTGFPGTLGFVGEELLVDGAVEAFPILGFFVIAAGALTGLAVLRMYFSLFCGRRDDTAHLGLLPREARAFAAVAIFLIGTGIVPGPIVSSRLSASELIFRLREDRSAGPGSAEPPLTDARVGVRQEARHDGPR